MKAAYFGCLALLGVALTVYSVLQVQEVFAVQRATVSFYVYCIVPVAFAAVTLMAMCYLYALTLGRVEHVAGSLDSATITRIPTFKKGAKIWFVRDLDFNSSAAFGSHVIFFLAGFVPHSCVAGRFLVAWK